jgi:23S rRNA (uridine2552-2'-O)-methyltransferase
VLQGRGRIVALDILPMDAINGVEFIQGDFTEDAVLEQLMDPARLGPARRWSCPTWRRTRPGCDCRPGPLDAPGELALDFAGKTLAPGGDFLVKVFQGRDFSPTSSSCAGLFATVQGT